jgi:hypothetical protein
MENNIPREVIIMTLQLTIMRNATINGWTIRRHSDKQLELTKKWNEDEDYDKTCHELIFCGNELFSKH